MTSGIRARFNRCAQDLRIPDSVRDELADDVENAVNAKLKKAFDNEEPAAPPTFREMHEEIQAAFKRMKRRDSRNTYAGEIRQQNVMDIRRQQTTKGKVHAAWRILNQRAGFNNDVDVRHSGMLERGQRLLDEHDDVLTAHLSVLENKDSVARITEVQLGFAKETTLAPKEMDALRDIRNRQEASRVAINDAVGDDEYLEFRRNFLPHDVMPSRLMHYGENEFVEFMGKRLKNASFWLEKDAEKLRSAYRSLVKNYDNAVPKTAFTKDPGHREFQFASGKGYWEYINRYNGAKNFKELLTSHLGSRARRTAAAEYLGNDVDMGIAEMVVELRAGGATSRQISTFRDIADKALGRRDVAPGGEQQPSQFWTAANGAVTGMNTLAMVASTLTLPLSIARSWGRAMELENGLAALFRIPQGAALGLEALVKSGMAREVLGAMHIPSMRANARLRENIAHIIDSTDAAHGLRAGDRIGRGIKTVTRKGVYGPQFYFPVSDAFRNLGGAMDNLQVAAIFEKRLAWDELSKAQKNNLKRRGGIHKNDYDAAMGAYWNNGGRQAGWWGSSFDYKAIVDPYIQNKFVGRSIGLADDAAGIGSARFSANLEWGESGSFGRFMASVINGLSKDPAQGTIVIAEAAQTMWQAGGWWKLQAVGGVVAIVAYNVFYGHIRSQLKHYMEYGEWHDRAERDPLRHYEGLLYLYGGELLGPLFVEGGYFIENESAVAGGSPAWDKLIKGSRELVRLPKDAAFDTGDSAILKHWDDTDPDKNADLVRDWLEEWAPLPDWLKRNIYHLFRDDRESLLEKWVGDR